MFLTYMYIGGVKMIDSIFGKVDSITCDSVSVIVGAFTLKIYIGTTTNYLVGDDVKLYIHEVIREDSIKLIGFNSLEEKELFTLLISCKGVGPKIALTLLRKTNINLLKTAIVNNDIRFLKALPLLGSKVAEQIILDLKDKISKTYDDNNENYQKMNDVNKALKAFGYKTSEYIPLTMKYKDYSKETGQIIKDIVQELSDICGN